MSEQHFVYVYRDLHGNPVYFGQGIGAARHYLADGLDLPES